MKDIFKVRSNNDTLFNSGCDMLKRNKNHSKKNSGPVNGFLSLQADKQDFLTSQQCTGLPSEEPDACRPYLSFIPGNTAMTHCVSLLCSPVFYRMLRGIAGQSGVPMHIKGCHRLQRTFEACHV